MAKKKAAPMPPKKPAGKTTSEAVAHLAGIALQDPSTPKDLLGIIASDLAQAEDAKKGKTRKK